MATVNLGSIKFNWQGAYAGGTAYAVDDVVSYNGSSYICKLASTGNLPTNTTYWDQMSSAGTNGTDGTDVGTVITTQGDILYRDGSGLQRLGAGTSGQFLKTQGTGANPVWSAVDSPAIVNVAVVENDTRYVLSDSGNNAVLTMNYTKILGATESKVIVHGWMAIHGGYSNYTGIYFDCLTSGMTSHNTSNGYAFKGVGYDMPHSSTTPGSINILQQWQDTTNFTAGSHTFELGWRVNNSDTGNRIAYILNPNSSDDARSHQKGARFVFYEVAL